MKTNVKVRLQRAAKIVTISTLAVSAAAAYGGSFSDLLEGLKQDSKTSLNVRTRYEHNETPTSDVDGYSVRTRLGWTSGSYEGVKLMVEMEDISFANPDDRPPLDVPTTELNQFWMSYAGGKLGRQIYTLDDHRFIGHVGWRQNIQTFDALTYSYAPNDKSKLNFGYLDAVHRVNATTKDLSGILANGSYRISEGFSLTGFAYLLDFDDSTLSSSDTYGLRGVGNIKGDNISYSYSFSYAKQFDNGGSATDFDVDYLAGDIGASVSGMSFGAGFEFLGGDGTTGFTTPLATVHKFNGFADLFAGNSLGLGGGLPQGLKDLYASFGFKAGDVPVKVFYHHFETENVSDYLGYEIDVVATYKVNEYVTLVGKFADYSSDGAETVSYGGADKQVYTIEANLSF